MSAVQHPRFPTLTVHDDGTIVGPRGKALRPRHNAPTNPYLTVWARCPVKGKAVPVYVHQAVAEAFHGPRPTPTHHAAHHDGDKYNNTAENVRWKTPAENRADMIRHGSHRRGDRHPGTSLTADDVLEIRRLCAEGVPQRVIAADYGITQSTVSRVNAGLHWGHVREHGAVTQLAAAA